MQSETVKISQSPNRNFSQGNGNTITSVQDSMQQTIDNLNRDPSKTINVPNVQGLTTEYADGNSWYAYFPLANVLGKNYSNLEMSVTRFTIPQLVMGSTEVSFKGYSLQMPTKLIDADTKEITIEYIVDSKWQNYRSLYKWCSATEGQINQVINTDDVHTISMTDFVDCRIYLLDHFKQKIISFLFKNSWVKIFQDLALDVADTECVHHSVTLGYSNYEIEDI